MREVSFTEAINAWVGGKTIHCYSEHKQSIYKGKQFGGHQLLDERDRGVTPNEIVNGIWYIEEGK
jgi:hypothetical protein